MRILVKDILEVLGCKVLAVYGNYASVSIQYLKDAQEVDEDTLDWVNPLHKNQQAIVSNSKAKVLFTDSTVKYCKELEEQRKIIIHVTNPKLCIVKVAHHFFERKYSSGVHPSAVVDSNAIIGKNVYIGPNAVVEACEIGDNVIIHGNCFIYKDTIIGDNVEIHAGAIVGSEAHNYVEDEQELVSFPHLGRAIIKNNVVIGSNSIVSRGVLSDTIVGCNTKIAQHVIVGANNQIGDNCLIRAHVMLAGSIRIAAHSIIGASAVVRERIKIGYNVFIGMGAVVIKDVPDNEVWIGNPARKLK